MMSKLGYGPSPVGEALVYADIEIDMDVVSAYQGGLILSRLVKADSMYWFIRSAYMTIFRHSVRPLIGSGALWLADRIGKVVWWTDRMNEVLWLAPRLL